MIIKFDRSWLDGPTCLGDPSAIVLLLRDPENGSPGRAVHDFFMADPTVWDPWHRVALITDQCPLKTSERANWFDGNDSDYYAVLCPPDATGVRRRGAHGSIIHDLLHDGYPDLFLTLDVLQSC